MLGRAVESFVGDAAALRRLRRLGLFAGFGSRGDGQQQFAKLLQTVGHVFRLVPITFATHHEVALSREASAVGRDEPLAHVGGQSCGFKQWPTQSDF